VTAGAKPSLNKPQKCCKVFANGKEAIKIKPLGFVEDKEVTKIGHAQLLPNKPARCRGL
jgi:hypothetical protein